ncbi:vWFA domain containing protein [Candidatus Nanohalovita haloferacivicina]|nr:vWFA domain containing protein [Candidatus Nanohalobia archaeon BNXNv]
MGNSRYDVADATKDYIDGANTGQGDTIAVSELGEQLQSLTTDKSDAKSAADRYWDESRSSCIGCGISKAHDHLKEGNNPIQVIVVLADAQGGYSGQADDARDDGVEVHGIMYPGADINNFEKVTDSTCEMNSDENSDGDNCWYGSSGTIDEVYDSIQEEVQAEATADLNMVMPDYTYTQDSFDSLENHADGENYIREDIDASSGTHTETFTWRPLTDGSGKVVKTGSSYIDFRSDGSTTTYNFPSSHTEDIYYVDLNVSDHSLLRRNGMITVNLTLRNKGNIESKTRPLHLTDEDNNILSRQIDPIPAGGKHYEVFRVAENNLTFRDAQRITAHIDPNTGGFWSTAPLGEGEALEPDETNNDMPIGYPPLLSSTSPSTVNWDDNFRFSLNFDHYYPDQVQGNYTVLEDGNKIRDEASYSKPAEGTLRTNQIDNDESRIYYNITSKIRGPQGALSVYNHTFYVSNPRPEIYAAEPKNLNSVYQNPVQLRAFVDDENNVENSNGLNVSIYNQETGNLLKEVEGVAPRTPVSYSWSEADEAGKTYRWNVTVSDDWDTVSEVFRFVKGSRVSYRTETESNYSYSGVVTSSGGQGAFRYSVRNRLEFNKNNMRTTLSGVDARFESTGTGTKSYALPKESSKTFNIIVNPGNGLEGQQYLTVTTTNEDLGINNTDKIPIFIRSDAKRSRGVPGLSILNILFMILASTLYFAGSH